MAPMADSVAGKSQGKPTRPHVKKPESPGLGATKKSARAEFSGAILQVGRNKPLPTRAWSRLRKGIPA